MKREVPATPFKVDGPNSTWTSSTDSPEKLAEQQSQQAAIMHISHQPANPTQEAISLANRLKRGQGSAAASGGSAQWGGSSASGQHGVPPSLHQHNTIQQHMYQQQVNQIDPTQLEQLLESLVNAKAEANYQQPRQQAQQEVESIRQQAGNNHQMLQEQVYQKLQQLNQEKQMLEMRERQTHQQAQQRFEQLQQEAVNQIKKLSEDNMRLQAELEDSRKSAEGQVNFVKLQAESERQRAVAELKELSSKLEVIMTHPERVGSTSGTMMGSPIGNPFEHLPQAYQSAQPTEIMSAGASIASANPLEVMYCTCCGSQNVIGRPSCWRCSTLLSTVTAKNGADLNRIQDHGFDPAPCPPPSLAPSSFRALQGVAASSASIAAAAAAPMAISARFPGECASNVAQSGNLASGGLMAQTGCGLGVGSNGGTTNQWGGFDPNGPRIQAGYIVPGRGQQGEKPKPAGLQGSQHGGIPSFSIHTPKNSSPTNGSSSSSKDSNEDGFNQAPKDGWLLPDETDESVYKHKHLKSIQITKLPNDATSCREWRAAFLAAVSRVDMTNRDVLVKFATWCMEGGRGRRFRDYLQNSNYFLLFNKHVAAELIKPEVLATNTELAHELTSWVESCSAKQQGPKGMALMHIIIAFTKLARTNPLH